MPPRRSRDRPGYSSSRSRVEPVAPPPSVPLLHPGFYDSQASYSKLLALAVTHPQLISNRWRKKSIALRTRCLDRAWAAAVAAIASAPFTGPNTHAKDEAIGKPSPTIAKTAPKFGQDILEAALVTSENVYPISKLALENYLYSPAINLENLSQSPAPLLNLLHARTMMRPSELGRWDYINVVEPALQLFEAVGDIKMDRETLQVVMIGKEETEYGLIKSWSMRSLDLLRGIVGKTVIPLEPEAKYLFKWQKVMIEFCLNCVLDILDADARKPNSLSTQSAQNINKASLQLLIKDVDTLPQATTQTGLHASRAHSLKMQFYSMPPTFDFDHAYQLAITMLREAQDNIDLLRTDPSYLLHKAEIFIEHRTEHIPDLFGRKGNPHSVESVQDAVKKLIHNGYTRLLLWNEIVILFEDANELIIDGRGVANETLDEIIARIQTLLTFQEGFLDTSLSSHAMAGPSLRGYFYRAYTESFVGKFILMTDSSSCTVYAKDPIAGILMCSAPLEGKWEKKVFTVRRISNEIERELLERPQLMNSIHPWVMAVLGEAAGMYELMDALQLYISSSPVNPVDAIDSTTPLATTINSFAEIMPKVNLSSFWGKGDGWKALQMIETSPGGLEAFWKIVDKQVSKLSKDGRTLADWVGTSKGRLAKKRKGKWNWQGQIWFADGAGSEDKDLENSPDLPELIPVGPYEDPLGYGNDTWVVTEDLVIPTHPRRRQMPLQTTNIEPSRPFGINAEGSLGATPDAPHSTKQKAKTRGIATEEEPTLTPSPPVAPPKPTISVSSRVHQLLIDLSSAAKAISWKDFVYLMSHLGFTCTPIGGSAFRFVPADPDVNESISFHRPHPEAVLTKRECMWIWRRLRRNYGWDAESFTVANRGAEGGIAGSNNAQEEVDGEVVTSEV